MTAFSAKRKISSFAMLAVGILCVIFSLALDCMGLKFFINLGNGNLDIRGGILVIGILLTIAGIYLFPTLKYHRAIVYGLFLFPLLATFLVTVIIPLFFGIGYSFTDWDGIRVRNVVGFENYIRMFRQPGFIWSILITFLFVFFNVILYPLLVLIFFLFLFHLFYIHYNLNVDHYHYLLFYIYKKHNIIYCDLCNNISIYQNVLFHYNIKKIFLKNPYWFYIWCDSHANLNVYFHIYCTYKSYNFHNKKQHLYFFMFWWWAFFSIYFHLLNYNIFFNFYFYY